MIKKKHLLIQNTTDHHKYTLDKYKNFELHKNIELTIDSHNAIVFEKNISVILSN